jgi:hypothetical protein
MTGRPGLFGGPRHSDAFDNGASAGSQGPGTDDPPVFNAPGFDPVWGTLGPITSSNGDTWLSKPQDPDEGGPTIDVDIFGDGFEIAGQIHAGQFPRLSDWLNMQQGFIQVLNAAVVFLGHGNLPDPDHQTGTLWLRVNQIVLVAERANIQTTRPGAPVVQKQRRRVSIVAPGYSLRGSLHVHTNASMKQLLDSPHPHFLPVTELTVRRLSEGTLVIRFPFALVNREQLISVLDDSETSSGDSANEEAAIPFHKRWGAA